MKKTLIALMALAGVACGASSSSYNELTSSLKTGMMYAWDFNAGSAITFQATGASDITNANNSTVNEGTTYAELVGSNCMHNKQGLTGFSDGDFTVSIDVMDLGPNNWYNVLTLGNDSNNLIQVQLTNGGDLMFYNAMDDGQLQSTDTGIDGDAQTWSTVTIVSDSTNGNLSLYVDGSQKASAGDWDAGELTTLSVGYACIGNDQRIMTDGYIDNLYIWNRALNASEVSALIIPEPATATLSLLALAGLAARRRRK